MIAAQLVEHPWFESSHRQIFCYLCIKEKGAGNGSIFRNIVPKKNRRDQYFKNYFVLAYIKLYKQILLQNFNNCCFMLYLLFFKLLLFFVEPNSKFALSFCRLRLLLKLLVSFWSRPISVNLCDAIEPR